MVYEEAVIENWKPLWLHINYYNEGITNQNFEIISISYDYTTVNDPPELMGEKNSVPVSGDVYVEIESITAHL